MKSFLTSSVATLLISLFGSFALAHGEVTIHWPSVNGLSIDNACFTGTTFKSLTPVKVCTQSTTINYGVSSQGEVGMVKRLLRHGEALRRNESLQQESVCSAYGLTSLEVSKEMTQTECAYYTPAGQASIPCTRFVSKTVSVGPTFSVEKITDYGQADQQSFFNFTVPNCR